MNINHTKISLELNSVQNCNVLEVRQGDIGTRFIDISLTLNGEPLILASTMVAKINATVDNIVVAEDVTATLDITNNAIIVELTENMLSLSGILKIDVILSEGEELITAETFNVKVGKSVINNNTVFKPQGNTIGDCVAEVAAARGAHNNLDARLATSETALSNINTSIKNKPSYTITSNLLRLSDGTYTKNGVSIEVKDNHVICTGKSTADTNILIPFDYSIISGKKYSFSLHNCTTSVATNGLNTITLANSSGQPLTDSSISQMGTNRICLYGYKNNSLTFTATSNNTCANLLLYVANGKTLNEEFDLQFEQGDATDYIKPVLLYADKAKSVVDDSVGLSACDSLIKTVITNSKDNQVIDVTPDFKYATKNKYRDYSNNLAEVAANNAVNMFVDCEATTRYVVSGYNFYHGNLLTVTDSQNNILAGYPGVSNGNYYQNIEFVTPDNAVRFCINNVSSIENQAGRRLQSKLREGFLGIKE